MNATQAVHGGPDAQGVPMHDFSSNSNACGPCPHTLAALQVCDASRYPDPAYTELKAQLAAFHGVHPGRIALAGSASEFIFRITAWVAQQGGATVRVPMHAYGDYAQAAQAWGLSVTRAATDEAVALQWLADPSSPLGQSCAVEAASDPATVQVLDCAYVPLRLSGRSAWTAAQRDAVWQLYTPNKALGLTGVRAAYAIAPAGAVQQVTALEHLCASWPVGAHGAALLHSWVQASTHDWLADSHAHLHALKSRQIARLQEQGWHCLPSDTNFFCARPPVAADGEALAQLLAQLRSRYGIKLRNAASFGLSGWVRLSVQQPAAQDALVAAVVSSNAVSEVPWA